MKTQLERLICALLILSIALPSFAQAPCRDSLYVALDKKNINELSPNEMTYFMERDQACKQAQVENRMRDEQSRQAAEIKNKVAGWVVFAVLCSAAAIVIPVVIIKKRTQDNLDAINSAYQH